MPQILLNGQLVDISQEQFDAWNQQNNTSNQQEPAGGSVLQINDQQPILIPNTAEIIPGQELLYSFQNSSITAPVGPFLTPPTVSDVSLARDTLGFPTVSPPTPSQIVQSQTAPATTGGGFLQGGYGSIGVVPPQPLPVDFADVQNAPDPSGFDPNTVLGIVPYRQVTQPSIYAAPPLEDTAIKYESSLPGVQSGYGPFRDPVIDEGVRDQQPGITFGVNAVIGPLGVQNPEPDPVNNDATGFIQQTNQSFLSATQIRAQAEPVTAPGVTSVPVQVDVAGGAGFENDAQQQAGVQLALKQQAQLQQSIRSQRSGFNEKDWRVKLMLAPQAQYLYNVAQPGDLLYPLQNVGVIFPYTPTISLTYSANYNPYNLTHSNHTGYFYTGSSVGAISLSGTFTAQDTTEANYLLAVIHFFRSVTKMFYGQDAELGAPPPLVYLSGYGQYQFSEHPCVVSSFTYSLPAEVDYIRAQSVSINNTDLISRRTKTPSPPSTSPIYSAISRLQSVFTPKGAEPRAKAQSPFDVSGRGVELGGEAPTYVPTQMEIQLQLLPLQSRSQISKQFSLREFAKGSLLRGGFW
jgi:hypothetical protein